MKPLLMAYRKHSKIVLSVLIGLALSTGLFAVWLGGGYFQTQLSAPGSSPQIGPGGPSARVSGTPQGLSRRSEAISTNRLQLSQNAKQLRDAAFTHPIYTAKDGSAILAYGDKKGNGFTFQIDYVAPDNRFVIAIQDTNNSEATRKVAEETFLRLLKTTDRAAACSLNVTVDIVATQTVSPLSFCSGNKTAQRSVSPGANLADVFSSFPISIAQASSCTAFQDPSLTYCQCGFLHKYFGPQSYAAQQISGKEVSCDPYNDSNGAATGLFQIERSQRCGQRYVGDLPDGEHYDFSLPANTGVDHTPGSCNQMLLDPDINAKVAHHVVVDQSDAGTTPIQNLSAANWCAWSTASSCSPTAGCATPPNEGACPLPPPPPPPPPPPGQVKFKKTPASDPYIATTPITLDQGQFGDATHANYVFDGVSPGSHTINIYVPNAWLVRYTLCTNDSTCHDAAPQITPAIPSSRVVSVSVSVPAGGFVDIWWRFQTVASTIPVELPPTGGSPTPSPPLLSNLRPDPLPSCAVTPFPATTRFDTDGATNVTYRLYEDNMLTWTGTGTYANDGPLSWWQDLVNLRPGVSYGWQVDASGPGGSTTLAAPEFTVPYCNVPPPQPSNFLLAGVPQCANTNYSGVRTTFDITNATVVEARLIDVQSGFVLWNNVGNGWATQRWWTWFQIEWGSMLPFNSYRAQFRTGNPAGWSVWTDTPSWSAPACPTPPDLAPAGILLSNGRTLAADNHKWFVLWPGRPVGTQFISAVYNNGNTSSSGFQVQWKVNGSTVSTSTHAGMGGLQYESFGHDIMSGYTFSAPGTYTVQFCVDTANAVAEPNESNNCANINVEVSTRADLSIACVSESATCLTDITGTPKSTFKPGEMVIAKFNLFTHQVPPNIPSNFWVEIFEPAANFQFQTAYCNQKPAVASKFITTLQNPVTLAFPAPTQVGGHYAWLLVDTRGVNTQTCTVDETDEQNNMQFLGFDVVAGDPLSADSDGDGFTNATEIHVGTDPYHACLPSVFNDGSPSLTWPADLKTGGTTHNKIDLSDIASFTAPVPRLNTSPGDANYSARWDIVPGSTIGKTINLSDISTLTNMIPPMFNGLKAFGGPACNSLPDLVMDSLSLTPVSPSAGNSISVSGTVRNLGHQTALASTTRFRIDVGNNGTWDVAQTAATGSLAVNHTETESWPNIWTAVAGIHKVEVCADVTSAVAEGNEANNCTVRLITVP